MLQTPVRGARLLVVDDEAAILFAMKQYFESLGYFVDCAREREEAEALVSYVRYDLVIADLRLTGTSGWEGFGIVDFVQERSPSTRVLLMTAHGSAEIEAEARRLGADLLLQKPKPLPVVAQAVSGLLGRGM